MAKAVAEVGNGIVSSIMAALNPIGTAIAKRHIASLGGGNVDKKAEEKDKRGRLVSVDETNRFCLLTSMMSGLLSKLKLTPAVNAQQNVQQKEAVAQHRHDGPDAE